MHRILIQGWKLCLRFSVRPFYSWNCLWSSHWKAKILLLSPRHSLNSSSLLISMNWIISHLSPSTSNYINMSLEFLVLIWRHDHSRHRSIAIQSSLLGYIIALEVWFQRKWKLYGAQVNLCLTNHTLTVVIIESTSNLWAKWLNRDSPSIA